MKLFGDFIEVTGKSKVLSKVGFDKLVDAVNTIAELAQDTVPENKFHVVFPFNFTHSVAGPVRLTNIDLDIHSLDHIQEEYDATHMVSVLTEDNALAHSKCSYVVLEQHGTDEHDALDKASQRAEMLRCVINFYKSYGNKARTKSNAQCISSIHPPKYAFVFDEDKYHVTHSDIFGEFSHSLVHFTNKEIAEVESLIHKVNLIKDYDLKLLIFKTLMKHTEAMDELKHDIAFESYWNILQMIALDPELTDEQMCSRLEKLFEKNTHDSLPEIMLARHMPNPPGAAEITKIKTVTQNLIMFLIDNAQALDTRAGLDALYEAE